MKKYERLYSKFFSTKQTNLQANSKKRDMAILIKSI